MILLCALFFILLILFVLSLKFNSFDIWNPCNMFFLFWNISTLSLIYLLDIVNLKIDMLFILVVILGVGCFFIGYNFTKKITINKGLSIQDKKFLVIRKNYIGNISFCIIAILIAGISINYYYTQLGLLSIAGSEMNESLNTFRQHYLQGDIEIPFYIRQFNRLLMTMAYVSCYSIARSLIYRIKLLSNKVSFFTIILFIISTIFQSARTNIIYLAIAFIIYISIFYIRKNRKTLSWKINYKIFGLSFGFIIFFGFLGTLMGRSGQDNIFKTISFYFSSGMLGLNQALKNDNIYIPNYFGEGTFAGIWRCINDYVININFSFEQSFMNLNGFSIGNTYTGLYKYYCDFGLLGVIVITFIIGYFTNRFYNKVINKKCGFMTLILFGYFMHGIVLFSYDELLISTQLSFGLICDLIYFYLIKKVFLK